MNINLHGTGLAPKENQVEPTIQAFCIAKYPYRGTVITSYRGELHLENKKICDLLSPLSSSTQQEFELRQKPNNRNNETQLNFTLEGVLSPKALNFIEKVREKNKKGDIPFSVIINVQYIESNFKIDSEIIGRLTRVQQSQTPPYFLLDRGEDTLLKVSNRTQKRESIVPLSAWIHDFMPIYEMGSFLVYEVPRPDISKLTDTFKQRLEAAYEGISKMEEAKIRGDWNEVIEDSRPVWELLRNKDAIKKILNQNGFTQDAINDFMQMVHFAFEYSSKFVHKLTRGKNKVVMPTIPAQKEDALFIYSLAVNIIHTLVKKINRQNKT